MSAHVISHITKIDYILPIFWLSHVASEDPTKIQISIFWFPADHPLLHPLVFSLIIL